jgi:hypothetical protein
VAKVNPDNGTFIWAKAFGDDQLQTVRKMALNNRGVLGFFGEFDGTIDLGGGVSAGPPVVPPDGQRSPSWTGTFFAGVRSNDGGGVFAVDLALTDERVTSMAASPVDGSFVLCGGTSSYVASPDPDVDVYLAKFSGSGELLWNASAALASGEQQSCEAVTVLDDGDVVFGGLHGYGASRALLMGRVDGATGAQTWSRTFPLTDQVNLPNDTAIALIADVAADANGNVVFAGTLFGEIDLGTRVGTLAARGSADWQTFSSDALIVKLDGQSGEPLWGKLYDHVPGAVIHSWEEQTSIAIDSSGDVHVSGNTRTPPEDGSSSGYYDMFLLKLEGQDGNRLCTRSYDGAMGQVSDKLIINRRGAGSARDRATLLGWFNEVVDFGDGLPPLRAPADHAYFLTGFHP